MKIGIFLAYGPTTNLTSEGLGRYLGGIVKGLTQLNSQTMILAPIWLRAPLKDLLRDLNIEEDKIELKFTKKIPIVWKIYQHLTFHKKHFVFNLIAKKFFSKSLVWFTKSSTLNFWKYLPVYLLLVFPVFCFAILFPFIICALFIYSKIRNKLNSKTKSLSKEKVSKNTNVIFFEMYSALLDSVAEQLVDIANKDNTCDIWFVPSAFWPQVNKISKKVIINAPDLVTSLYPIEFHNVPGALYSTAKIKQTLEKGKYFITYSEFIRQTLLIRDYRKNPDNVIAIKHINNNSKPFIEIANARSSELNSKHQYDLVLCKKLLNKAISRSCPTYYARNMNFDNVHYIFYSSQIRPHKNFISLLKAFEYLIHTKYLQIKLVLTGNVVKDSCSSVSKYIYEHNLEYDVLSFNRVSATVLAALYRCADLVVNPSMYEGGFAFSLGESMSVGTPCILANTPFEMEVLEPEGLEDITFDPTDWESIADKIEYGLSHREELYSRELPLYQKIMKRTPQLVAAEYIKAFEYFNNKNV